MAGNTIGKIFTLLSFGESHGELLGAVIDGCPAGIPLTESDIQPSLDRRRPGQSAITTPRNEPDQCKIVSGTFDGLTTGMPIAVIVPNTNQRSQDYAELKTEFRPGHADEVFHNKYGHRDHRGGGRSSGRETISRVIAGSIAQKILPQNTKLFGHTKQVGQYIAKTIDLQEIENNSIRCADKNIAPQMIKYIEELQSNHDSTGAIIELIIQNPPANLGEPVFDKLKADLAKAIMSIGAVTGIAYGSGFAVASLTGQEYTANPENFGGILGGISTGETITMQIGVKPTSTIGEKAAQGRHDPCIAPRAIPVIEAMAAITLADHYLRNKVYESTKIVN